VADLPINISYQEMCPGMLEYWNSGILGYKFGKDLFLIKLDTQSD
jgi:hypothetical protein